MRVWVTRDERSDGPLSCALREAGLAVVLEPVLERRVLTDAAEVIGRLGPDDWLVLTSVFAIEAVALQPARAPRVAVVGESSREAALGRGFRVEMVSPKGTAASLFAELRDTVRRGRICYPRSSLATPPPRWGEVELLSPVLYETLQRRFDRNVIETVEVAAVASPSAVDAIGVVDLRFASIGPTTSAALRRIGVEPWVEAPEQDFTSLAAAIADQGNESVTHP